MVRAANLLPIILILLTATACTPKAQRQLPPEQANSQVLQSNADSQSKPEPPATASAPSTTKVDVDLTKMNANMIYSYIFEMIVEPDTYTGKTIKVNGYFYSVVDDETNERYYAVIIPDALACCKQGMEFKWLGNHTYPQDYPAEEQQVTITGTYRTTFLNDEISYSYLEVSDLEF